MITKKDVGKKVRLIEPSEKHAGKIFILEVYDDRFKANCKIVWDNKYMRLAERVMIVKAHTITLVNPKKNWFKSLRKHMKIKWNIKGYWKWPELKTGGK